MVRHGIAPRSATLRKLGTICRQRGRRQTDCCIFSAQIPFTQTWHDLERIRRQWPRRLVLKGILAPNDAVQAQRLGVDKLIVSNHGGRQLDAAPAALEMLPAIRAVLGQQMTLMLDGGIRRGSDILKAWALGADFVFVGRPALYGVAADGLAGARRALAILREEIDLTLAQLGCADLALLTGNIYAKAGNAERNRAAQRGGRIYMARR